LSVGRDYGAQTEVLSGVNPGDLVVINPTDAAQEGAKVKTHELKEGPQPGQANPGAQGPQGGANKTRRSETQTVQPLNPEKNVPLNKGAEPGAPGELQGPGAVVAPQPDYGSYDMPRKGQAAGSGKPNANSGRTADSKATTPGSTGSGASSTQPH
jgi:hypothetical protein